MTNPIKRHLSLKIPSKHNTNVLIAFVKPNQRKKYILIVED